jgi:hypothetical protein
MVKKAIVLLVWAMLLLSLLFSTLFISGSASAGPIDPEVGLFLQDKTLRADVSNVTNLNPIAVKFIGWVSVDFNPSTSVLVELTVSDSWQLASIAPTAMLFSSDSPEDKIFTVEVKITHQYIVDCEKSDEVAVFSSWSLYPGGKPVSGGHIIGTVLIEKYHRFWVSDHIMTYEIRPGDDVAISFSVNNMGNGDDIFVTTITNLNELQESGFEVELPEPVKALRAGDAQVAIMIKTPMDLPEDTIYKIDLEVKPVDEINSNVTVESITFYIKTKPRSSPYWAQFFCLLPIIFFVVLTIIVIIFIYKQRKTRNISKK